MNKKSYYFCDTENQWYIEIKALSPYGAQDAYCRLYPDGKDDCMEKLPEELKDTKPYLVLDDENPVSMARAVEKVIDNIGYDFDFCYIEGNSFVNIYYNPDSNEGGQIVVDYYDLETVGEYLNDLNGDYAKFNFGEISDMARNYCYDFNQEGDLIWDILNGNYIERFDKSEDRDIVLEKADTMYQMNRAIEIFKDDKTRDVFIATASYRLGLPQASFTDIMRNWNNAESSAYKKGIMDTFESLQNEKLCNFVRDCIDRTYKEIEDRVNKQMTEYDDLDR